MYIGMTQLTNISRIRCEKMTTFKQWFNGEGHYRYESFSDFKWSLRDGLIVFCGLELLVLCTTLVIYLVAGIDIWLLLSIGTALASAAGYVRFAVQWKEFNI
jgi:hypothetical protein